MSVIFPLRFSKIFIYYLNGVFIFSLTCFWLSFSKAPAFIFSLLLSGLVVFIYQQEKNRFRTPVVLIFTNQQWQLSQKGNMTRLTLQKTSIILPFACVLHFKMGREYYRLLIFKDSLPDQPLSILKRCLRMTHA